MLEETDTKYLHELAKSYPTRSSAVSEIINLNAILNLPKGTEHFMSDLHGEHQAFSHIRRNASGVVRRKVDSLFERTLTKRERAELATLIYYPKEKLEALSHENQITDDWYNVTLVRLLEVCRLVSSKYTRSKVRKHLAKTAIGYDYIIDELLNNDYDRVNKGQYYANIIKSILSVDAQTDFIIALCAAIKSMVIDHLHIVGDIFDRGPRADLIIDELMSEQSIDIQWGNHDALWMGAAAGSTACIATVLNNSITYKNLDVIEIGYGISLRPLTLFANQVYNNCDMSNYLPKGDSEGDKYLKDDDILIARMHKAISIIQFKLEGGVILRNPGFNMNDRLLLDKIDWDTGTVRIKDNYYHLKDTDFPTIDRNNPYELTDKETEVIQYLKNAFMRSEKLQAHIKFLYEKGEVYTIFNENLLFHGCIPLEPDGSFMKFPFAHSLSGRAFMDFCDKTARQGYFSKEGTLSRNFGKDFLWFLWCGKDSPLCARKKIATFERLLIENKSTWEEPKNAYYKCWNDEKIAQMILSEFGLDGERSHIINGHIPVQKKKGENPIKANGKLILIDGGFCRAYQSSTGIAGYTLIYNADGMRISAHEPFHSIDEAIINNTDIISDTVIFEQSADKIRVNHTDTGKKISEKIRDLLKLLNGYETGTIKENV